MDVGIHETRQRGRARQVERPCVLRLDDGVIAPDRRLAYVANYGDDTISVIDLDPASATYHHTVLQLGKLRGED